MYESVEGCLVSILKFIFPFVLMRTLAGWVLVNFDFLHVLFHLNCVGDELGPARYEGGVVTENLVRQQILKSKAPSILSDLEGFLVILPSPLDSLHKVGQI